MASISVAMATYNGEQYVAEQLASISAQTKLPDELVVCDDGSTDATLEIVRRFADTAPFPVRIHVNPANLGYKQNFIRCAQLCSSDLIAFCDQDDKWFINKLEIQSKRFESEDVLISCHSVALINQDSFGSAVLQQFPSTGVYKFANMMPFAFALGFTQVMRASMLNFSGCFDIGLGPKNMAHDELFFFIAGLIGRIHYDATPLAFYRQHEKQTTGQKVVEGRMKVLRSRFSLKAREYTAYLHYSDQRIRVLRKLTDDRRFAEFRSAFTDAQTAYSELRRRHERRLCLYQAQGLISKFSAFAKVIMSADYRLKADPWHYTVAGCAKDLLHVITPS